MPRIYRIIGFLYLAYLAILPIAGGHIDHTATGEHLCFETCQPVNCNDCPGQRCYDESILEHLSETSFNIKTILIFDHPILYVVNGHFILTPAYIYSYVLKSELLIPFTFQFNNSQTRAPPYFS